MKVGGGHTTLPLNPQSIWNTLKCVLPFFLSQRAEEIDGLLSLHDQRSCELRDSYLSASVILELRDSYLSTSLNISWFYLSVRMRSGKNTSVQLTAEFFSFSCDYHYLI